MPLIYATTGDKERSKAHRHVEKILDSLGINYISEQPFPPYTSDIYLPEWHLALEVDGPFHSKSKDRVRDAYLEAHYGLKTFRMTLRWISSDKVRKAVTKFIEDNAVTAMERKGIWLAILP
jgi:very-short-patch-repair endonuclease